MAMKKRVRTKAKGNDEIFGEIVSGLGEAIAYAKGATNRKAYRVHIPDKVDVGAIRKSLGMTQNKFSELFGFTPARIKDWEQGRYMPGAADRAYLKVIEERPAEVLAVLTKKNKAA